MEQTTISIDRAIATGEWSQEALTELDNLINDIENGRKVFKRFPQAATATLAEAIALQQKLPLSYEQARRQVVQHNGLPNFDVDYATKPSAPPKND